MIVPKPFWQSKTLWLNVGFGVATALWPYLQKVLTPEEAGAVVVIANMLVRFFTTQPVTVTGGK